MSCEDQEQVPSESLWTGHRHANHLALVSESQNCKRRIAIVSTNQFVVTFYHNPKDTRAVVLMRVILIERGVR